MGPKIISGKAAKKISKVNVPKVDKKNVSSRDTATSRANSKGTLPAPSIECCASPIKLQEEIARLTLENRALKRCQAEEVTEGVPSPKSECACGDPNLSTLQRASRQSVGAEFQSPSLPQLLSDCMSLPRMELPKFNGDPLDFWRFRRAFVQSVESVVTDAGKLLSYLTYYCDGTARKSILHCSIMDAKEGYEEAWVVLETRFGDPAAISRGYLLPITSGPPIRSHEHDELNQLATSMKACEATLRQLKYVVELNSRATIGAIVRRLPAAARTRWYDVAGTILRQRREPVFTDLVNFVYETTNSAAAEQMYYQLGVSERNERMELPRRRFEPATRPPRSGPPRMARTFATSTAGANNKVSFRTAWSVVCPKCTGTHYLNQCVSFASLPAHARLAFVGYRSLCVLCLKSRHKPDRCRSRISCGLGNCRAIHHPLVHDAIVALTMPVQTEVRSVQSYTCNRLDSVALGVVAVRVRGPAGERIVNALLDSGSDSTFIQRSLADELGASGKSSSIATSTLHGVSRLPAIKVRLEVSSLGASYPLSAMNAWAVPTLPVILPAEPAAYRRWKHLEDLPVAYVGPKAISLVMGMDIPVVHQVLESRFGAPHEPYGVRTPVGWTILGPLHADHLPAGAAGPEEHNSTVSDREFLRQEEYPLELSESATTRKGNSRDDESALAAARNTIRQVNGHYEIALPWKEDCPQLPLNHATAFHRLKSLRRRFDRDAHLERLYDEAIKDYIDKGYAEWVAKPISSGSPGRVWYLPHHPVFHPHKPEKVRVVFDCASATGGVSLNSQLLTGPDIVNSLFGVLLRFRQYPYVVTADVEAMFHQVKVPERDRDCFRFLWWRDGDKDKAPATLRMTVHPFGATSSPFCASFALRRSLADWAASNKWSTVRDAEAAFYVDDCLFSAPSKQNLGAFIRNVRCALTSGGFNLTKWSTNVPELLPEIPQSDRSDQALMLDLQPETIQRALGVLWSITSDEISFVVSDNFQLDTKRKLLSFVASVYDPLGFLAPVLIPGRLAFQETCRRGVSWDDKLDDDLLGRCKQWAESLSALRVTRIPRCLTARDGVDGPFELHCFCDASQQAYAATIYLRIKAAQNEYRSHFLCGKARVNPLKTVTIPRLELTAAVLGARLTLQVIEELTLPIRAVTYWTDSMVVLQTLRNRSTRFQTFVANRVSLILDSSKVSQWKYVDTQNNPADIATRGLAAKDLVGSTWLNGPSFLHYDESQWPVEPGANPLPAPSDEKIALATLASANPESWFGRFSRFSSWISLLRAIAWLRRFCSYIAHRRQPLNFRRSLSCAELREADRNVIRLTQKAAFPAEYYSAARRSSPDVPQGEIAGCAQLRALAPVMIDGLIRVGGRLRLALTDFECKHPAILPKSHFVTRLIVRHYHETNGHVGASQVLAAVRQHYWILKGHASVRSVLTECHHCRRWSSLPCIQSIAPLPVDRTQHERPFSYVGVDYFGPLLVKRGRATEKRYGCIFTCLSLRAVHIEIAASLETDSFLCAFARFVARRGCPSRLRSDNGGNFRGAESKIRICLREWNQERITKKLLSMGCDWEFTAPKASHQGGVWERMIRSVRRILRSMLGDRLVDDETLHTTLLEVEKILNDRPLTKVTSDPNDEQVLTPNSLLLLYRNPATPGIASDNLTLRTRWRRVHQLAEQFWKRWVKEYLPSLLTAQRWLRQGRNLNRGDVVLLGDNEIPRGRWPTGVVEEARASADGRVREVTVRTTTGTYRRDIRQLYLLEAHDQQQA